MGEERGGGLALTRGPVVSVTQAAKRVDGTDDGSQPSAFTH